MEREDLVTFINAAFPSTGQGVELGADLDALPLTRLCSYVVTRPLAEPRLLSTLVGVDWELEAAAEALGATREELLARLRNNGLGHVLRPGLRWARRRMEERGGVPAGLSRGGIGGCRLCPLRAGTFRGALPVDGAHVRRPAFPIDPSRAVRTALSPSASIVLALLCGCSPRPETATHNEPPTGATQSEPAAAPAKAVGAAGDEREGPPRKAEAGEPAAEPTLAKAETPTPAPAEPEAVDPLGPLPDEVRARFEGLPRDPKPDALVRNSHYWISNELNQDLWYEHVADLGGAYLGVGTDQNYLLAGWAKSDLMVVVDFDEAIADLHQVYLLFFEEAETFEDFFERWSPEREEEGLALIDERLGDRPDHKKIRKAYKIARQLVWARLRKVRKIYPERDIPTFVSDQAQYDHIRTLVRNGRVFATRGDFTANDTMVAVAEAMRDSGFAFNVIYLSNVEQYVDYTPEWRRNFIEIPVSDKGVVVRTLGWGAFGFAEGEKYHYNVQPAPKFQEWLKTSRVTNLPRMLYYRTKTDVQGLSLLDGEVQASKRPPTIAE